MNEKSERYREASEAHLERTRSSLQKDIKTHESAFKELGGVIRKDRHTVRGPAAALSSPSEAFAFPTLQGHSLAGEEVSLSADGLFHRQLTLLGCCGSQHGQEMVDGWLEGLSAALVPRAATSRCARCGSRSSTARASRGCGWCSSARCG